MRERDLILEKASRVRLLLTDCDGVLTDGCVYYSAQGEELKRFSIHDGMGVERLRTLVGVETGIITGERSLPLRQRAKKLCIEELHLGIRDKLVVLYEILEEHSLPPHQVAYIGDDTNDVEVMKRVGLSACPADGMRSAKVVADYVCQNGGGRGAFREFAELIIAAKNGNGNLSDTFPPRISRTNTKKSADLADEADIG